MSGGSGLHDEEEEHVNHERWLVTYADMVTLLMVLFIVMFAISQVDQKKFMALKSGLAAGFATSSSVLPGSNSLLEQAGVSPIAPIGPLNPQADGSGAGNVMAAADRASRIEARDEAERLSGAAERIRQALKEKKLLGDVKTTIDERGLVLSLVSKHVVFEADSATLTTRGMEVVNTLAPVLLELPEDIEVSGHTNQAAGKPKYYASDWDLSSARAVTVLRRLNEDFGLPAERLSVAAYGAMQPLVDPSEPGSQKVNKRVDLVVRTSVSDSAKALVDDYADLFEPQGSGPAGEVGSDPAAPATSEAPAAPAAQPPTEADAAPAVETH
jgi:chemotaxis protein MotB